MRKRYPYVGLGLLLAGWLVFGVFRAQAAEVSYPSSSVGSTSITINWTTSVPTDTCVKIGQYSNALTLHVSSDCGSPTALTTAHTVAISSLGPSTTYFYTVGYQNPGPAYFSPLTQNVTTGSVSTAPSGISISIQPVSLTGTTAQITWTTSTETDSCLRLGRSATTLTDQGCTLELGNRSLNHSRAVSGLSVATYYFNVGYSNPVPLTYDSGANSFAVTNAYTSIPAPPRLTGPQASSPIPPVSLSWSVVTDASEYRLFRRTPPDSYGWSASSVTPAGYSALAYADAAVEPGTSYQYYVSACNTLGCSAAYNYITVTTPRTFPTPTPAPAADTSSVQEGNLMRASGDIDVYIVKFVGAKKFRRLVLSPSVFKSYQHLRWENIKQVPQATLEAFAVSDLVRAVGDPKVYRLYPAGDTGEKRWVTTADAFLRFSLDWDAIYEINTFDRDSYTTSSPLE